MNSHITKSVAAMGLALALGACAMPGVRADVSADQLARIRTGLTQDEVRALVGNPPNFTDNARTGATEWTYSFNDEWGYPSEFDVEFDAHGKVTETFSERTKG
jgi:outer membrane protein assembly factor BamE (lipoprotein component of BamABCDE complex)